MHDPTFFEIAFRAFLTVAVGGWLHQKFYGTKQPEAPSDQFGSIPPEVLKERQWEELEYKDKWEKQIAHSNYRPCTPEEWQALKASFPQWFSRSQKPKSLSPPFLDLPRSEYRRE